MNELTGRLLVASPLMGDPNFVRTVVAILQHGDDGALGVVVNRPSEEPVAPHLPEWSDLVVDPAVVFVGGPVEPEIAVALTPTPGALGAMVDVGSDPDEPAPVRIFSGYAGWSPGQLEAEIDEGAWFVVGSDEGDAFDPDPETLWSRVLRRQSGVLALLATFPPDPVLN